jgi:hypothetical protein
MLWASLAWWRGNKSVLYPLSVAYHSMARWITSLPPSTQISNLLTCAHLPLLNVYLDYLSSKFAIRLLFLPAGCSLSSLPLTPYCASSAPGTSHLKDLIKHLLTGMLEDQSTPPIIFNIANAPAINLNKHDKPTLCYSSWVSSLPSGTFLLYTDGSKLDNEQTGYCAATYKITTDGLRQIHRHHCNLGTYSEVFDTELHAIYEGLLHLPTLPCMQQTTAYLCIDN